MQIEFRPKVVDWLAYPEYTLRDDLNSFVLTPGLYYTSRLAVLELLIENGHHNLKSIRIEWAASAMEMSVLAASNVANLVKVGWSSMPFVR